MSRYPNSSNPFEDDEEEEDFTFVNKPNSSGHGGNASFGSAPSRGQGFDSYNPGYGGQQGSGSGSYNPAYGGQQGSGSGSYNPAYDRRQQLMYEANASEDRQLESTRRALASIHHSESIGVATAEELVRQGEILDNVENKTTDITQNLKTSQRHLTSIKSVFGSLKNWWSGPPLDPKKDHVQSHRKLKNTVLRENDEDSAYSSAASHATNTSRGRSDVSGFYDTENDLDSQFLAGSRNKPSHQRMIDPVTNSAREKDIDDNLGLMSAGMANLKALAADLGNEIDSQNDQLDRINKKVEIADHHLDHQNRQIRQVLKK